MNKIQEFLDKIGIEDKIVDFDKNNEPITPSYIIEEWNKAINYTRCCMGEAEQLRDEKVKDIVNLAKSELSNYNKQKVLKVETDQDKWHKKLLKKIVELNS